MNSFWNFADISSYFHLKSFTWKRYCPISSKLNVTKLTKATLKSSYRVLQVTSKWKTLKQPVYFSKTVEFCSTFDIQISITVAIFWEKLQNYTFWKAHRRLSKHANIHIDRAPHYKKTALFLKNVFFSQLFLQNNN